MITRWLVIYLLFLGFRALLYPQPLAREAPRARGSKILVVARGQGQTPHFLPHFDLLLSCGICRMHSFCTRMLNSRTFHSFFGYYNNRRKSEYCWIRRQFLACFAQPSSPVGKLTTVHTAFIFSPLNTYVSLKRLPPTCQWTNHILNIPNESRWWVFYPSLPL